MNGEKLKENNEEMLGNCPMTISQPIVMRINSVSSQRDSKQSDFVETPYFDKLDSICDADMFKNQIEFQNSISVKQYEQDQQWSLLQKIGEGEDQTISVKSEKDDKQKENESIIDFKTQKRVEKDELSISLFKPEVLHPTMQRKIAKKQIEGKEHQINFKEIKRVSNSKKRSHEDTERQMQIRDKKQIEIGGCKDCDYVINDYMSSISKKHATLCYEEDTEEWVMIDQSSNNGTYLIKEEIILKTCIELLIGTFICQVKSIIFDEGQKSKKVHLYFYNIVDDSISSFSIELDLKRDSTPYYIGKKHQKQFREDIIVHDVHCFLQVNSHFDVILINIDTVYDQVGIKLTPETSFKLSNESIFKFGFLNKYKLSIVTTQKPVETTFSQSIQEIIQNVKETINACLSCTQTKQKIYYLKPCNHQSLCLECILTKSNDICPSCNSQFVDFT